jgi:hypothetical protein
MLRSKFEDDANAQDDVFEVTIVERLALPLVFLSLTFPEIAGEFGGAIFPAATDSHTLVQLDAYIRETRLPNVVNFEFPFNSGA